MALEDEDAVMKALEVTSLDGLSESKQQELVKLMPDVAPELQERLLARYPGLRTPYAVMAIDALEDDLKTILNADEASSREAFAALADARRIVEGELDKFISDERWKYLMDMIRDLTQMAIDKDTENKNFIGQQANADRIAKRLEKALPYIDYAIRVGVQIMLARR